MRIFAHHDRVAIFSFALAGASQISNSMHEERAWPISNEKEGEGIFE